jgi:putative transposase
MIFVDAINATVRGAQLTTRPVYVVIGMSVAGERTSSGCGPVTAGRAQRCGWPCSPGSRTAVSKDRGVVDVCIAVCDWRTG